MDDLARTANPLAKVHDEWALAGEETARRATDHRIGLLNAGERCEPEDALGGLVQTTWPAALHRSARAGDAIRLIICLPQALEAEISERLGIGQLREGLELKSREAGFQSCPITSPA